MRTRIFILGLALTLVMPSVWADGPRCENCKPVKKALYECLHWADDKDGAPCSTKECIENVLDSASCIEYPERTGAPKCDTKIIEGAAIIQTARQSPECPSVGTVHWSDWLTMTNGCGKECNSTTWRKACETRACDGKITRGPFNRGERAKCGC